MEPEEVKDELQFNEGIPEDVTTEEEPIAPSNPTKKKSKGKRFLLWLVLIAIIVVGASTIKIFPEKKLFGLYTEKATLSEKIQGVGHALR